MHNAIICGRPKGNGVRHPRRRWVAPRTVVHAAASCCRTGRSGCDWLGRGACPATGDGETRRCANAGFPLATLRQRHEPVLEEHIEDAVCLLVLFLSPYNKVPTCAKVALRTVVGDSTWKPPHAPSEERAQLPDTETLVSGTRNALSAADSLGSGRVSIQLKYAAKQTRPLSAVRGLMMGHSGGVWADAPLPSSQIGSTRTEKTCNGTAAWWRQMHMRRLG